MKYTTTLRFKNLTDFNLFFFLLVTEYFHFAKILCPKQLTIGRYSACERVNHW